MKISKMISFRFPFPIKRKPICMDAQRFEFKPLQEKDLSFLTDWLAQPDNLKAIRCYEKIGFQKIAEITTPDGPALTMVLSRP